MKAFTLYQPWASLVIAGAKPFEFRGWNFMDRYPRMKGQRIVIHASARKIKPGEVHDLLDALRDGGEAWAATCLNAEQAAPVLDAALAMTLCDSDGSMWLPYGAGLGTVVLGEPRNGIEIAQRDFGYPVDEEVPGLPGFDSDRRDHANWGWPMLDIEAWPQPIPMRGFQGFWNWPTPEAAGL